MVVITGAQKGAFSAGADIKEMASGDSMSKAPHVPAVVEAIEACRVPVVAAIDGVALGGGCEVGRVIAYSSTVAPVVHVQQEYPVPGACKMPVAKTWYVPFCPEI